MKLAMILLNMKIRLVSFNKKLIKKMNLLLKYKKNSKEHKLTWSS